ncbi:MAG: 5'/3'-nucleotidase SurE, partial [Myxococcota bacterium]|nr:5'/3'-nucleotidase SurE [Myxococcota bacterium]
MRILLSNDDGHGAPGILALRKALRSRGDVLLCAPLYEQSASSHAFTLHSPLRIVSVGEGVFAVDGTPADSVYIGVHHLCETRPDLVVSGINRGANLGDDVHYSGTVAAAMEAAFMGIPAISVSLHTEDCPEGGRLYWETAGALTLRVIDALFTDPLAAGVCLNLNVPNRPLSEIPGIRVTPLGRRRYHAQ